MVASLPARGHDQPDPDLLNRLRLEQGWALRAAFSRGRRWSSRSLPALAEVMRRGDFRASELSGFSLEEPLMHRLEVFWRRTSGSVAGSTSQ